MTITVGDYHKWKITEEYDFEANNLDNKKG